MKLIYVPVCALGHILPSLPIAEELVKKGVEVTYFAPANFRERVEKTGARFAELPSGIGEAPVPEGDFLSVAPCIFIGEAMNITDIIVRTIEEDRPDAVIADALALGGKYAAFKTGLPLVYVFTGLASGEPFSASRFWPKYPDDDPGRAQGIAMAREMQDKYGGPLQTVDQIFDSWAGFNIVNVTKSFHPAADAFDPDRFFFAGAQIAPRTGDAGWQAPADGKPLLYTSLGSVFNNWPEFYTMLFEAVKGLDINVLCSIGRALRPEDIGPVPANVTLMEFTPQLEVLAHCDYFITHAGINSIMEAMYFGVPLLCVPQMAEQEVNARQAVELGVSSAALAKNEVTAATLRAGLEKLMNDPSFRERAQAISDEMHQSGGCDRTAEAVIEYVKRCQGCQGDRYTDNFVNK